MNWLYMTAASITGGSSQHGQNGFHIILLPCAAIGIVCFVLGMILDERYPMGDRLWWVKFLPFLTAGLLIFSLLGGPIWMLVLGSILLTVSLALFFVARTR